MEITDKVEQAGTLAPESQDPIVDLDAEQAGTLAPEDADKVKSEDTEAKVEEPAKDAESAGDSDEDSEQRRRKETGSARLKARNAALQAENEALKSIVPKQDDATALKGLVDREIGPAPKEADFTDYLEFQNAKIAYETEKRIVGRELKQKAAQAQEAQRLSDEETFETFTGRVESVRERIKDFDAVLKSATASPQNPDVIRMIVESEKGAELAYYLSKNPKVVLSLDKMPPLQAAREIGKLEASVSSATPKTVTKAPEPVPSLRGGIASPSKDPDKMSYEEYAAWRKAGGGH